MRPVGQASEARSAAKILRDAHTRCRLDCRPGTGGLRIAGCTDVVIAVATASGGTREVTLPGAGIAQWKDTTANTDSPGYITAVCEPGGVAPRSPRVQAGSITVPVLLVHGDADTRVPTEQSLLMPAALDASGRRVELLLVPGAQHRFTAAEEAIARPVVDPFLASLLK